MISLYNYNLEGKCHPALKLLWNWLLLSERMSFLEIACCSHTLLPRRVDALALLAILVSIGSFISGLELAKIGLSRQWILFNICMFKLRGDYKNCVITLGRSAQTQWPNSEVIQPWREFYDPPEILTEQCGKKDFIMVTICLFFCNILENYNTFPILNLLSGK